MARKQVKKSPGRGNNTPRIQYTSVRTKGSEDPPDCKTDLSLTQRFQLDAVAVAGVATVTFAAIAARIPGGSAVWDRMRVQHVEVWGPDSVPVSANQYGSSAGMQVTMNTNNGTNFNTDVPTFTDHGTVGSRRPHVSFVPDMFTRMQWNPSASTDSLLTITSESATYTGSFIVHVTVQVRSVPPAGIQFQRSAQATASAISSQEHTSVVEALH
jgi:hypothetical protein